ncbi:MAG: YicC family protein, partial [Myxococcota bacterium]
LNEPLAEQYHAVLERLREKLGVKEPLRMESFVALRDVVLWKEPEVALEAFWQAASAALSEALAGLGEMRAREGEALDRDLRERLAGIDKALEWIRGRLAGMKERTRTALREKVKALLEGAAPDPWRMEQEILFYTERMDTSEELTRLASHLAQFRSLLDAGEGPVGRKLDFIVQEIMRESNTINAKIGDAEAVHRVVEIKAEVEKIREQVQNVE